MSRACDITGKKAQFGNNVSHSNRKTRRRFNVNLHNVSLKSEALAQIFPLKIATSTLRSIDHNGGLDGFLSKTANTKLTNEAVKIKRKIKKAVATK